MGVKANDWRSTDPLYHGAYICMTFPRERRGLATLPVEAVAAELGLRNEFWQDDGTSTETFGLIRRSSVTGADTPDERLLNTAGMVHVASTDAFKVDEFISRVSGALGGTVTHSVLRGVARPTTYTGNAMHNFAYAHRLLQQPGSEAPNAFFLPMSKTSDWWKMGWMQRHTFFLPRYDDQGHVLSEGHALVAEAGVDAVLRRTYQALRLPASDGGYDFLNYFECADDAVEVFHEVCRALRDVNRNPEWRYVREGPTWQGRRVETWATLVTSTDTSEDVPAAR